MRTTVVVVVAVAMAGCASITGNKLQPVSVQTIQDNSEVAGAGCTLTNDAGKWFVTTPGSVTIQKSTGDLAVDCSKDEGKMVGHENIVSKANGGVWGNIILGGGIGYVVDRNTGAGFDYPPSITVMLNRISSALGITEEKVTTTNEPAKEVTAPPIAVPAQAATSKDIKPE
jgi:hypothetical protein